MSLWSTQINQIMFKELEEFCNEAHPENLCLDYKGALSSRSDREQIAKIACAFANSYGGICLIGVGENKLPDGRGVPAELSGVDQTLGVEKRIRQICLDGISPPLIVELVSCPLPVDGTKHVVLMRVPESDQGPHFIRATGRTYVRDEDISHLIEGGRDATPEDHEWLRRRREKAIDFRNYLLELPEYRANLSRFIAISIIPLYPRLELFDLHEISKTFEPCNITPETANHSIGYYSQEEIAGGHRQVFSYFEANEYGLLTRIFEPEELTRSSNTINVLNFLSRLRHLLTFAGREYSKSSYLGYLQVRLKLVNLKGYSLVDRRADYEKVYGVCKDKQIIIDLPPTSAEALSTDNFLYLVYRKFLWALGGGFRIDQDTIDNQKEYIKEHFKKGICELVSVG